MMWCIRPNYYQMKWGYSRFYRVILLGRWAIHWQRG